MTTLKNGCVADYDTLRYPVILGSQHQCNTLDSENRTRRSSHLPSSDLSRCNPKEYVFIQNFCLCPVVFIVSQMC